MASRKPDNLSDTDAPKRRIPRIGGNWRYFALFRLLQLSPSYWLAHEEAISGVSPQSGEPMEFDLVRRTYRLFGPIWEIPFWEWWRTRGERAFGLTGGLGVTALGETTGTPPTEPERGSIGNSLSAYLCAPSVPASLLLAIPLVGTKKQLLEEIEHLLAVGLAKAASGVGYRIVADKTRRETVNAAIRTVQTKAHFGGPLYVVGNRAVIADYLRTDDSRDSGYGDERRTMAMVTSRQLKRAHIWSENAARGRFPSQVPPDKDGDWPAFDFVGLKSRLDAYAESSLAALALIPEEQRTNEARYAGRNWTVRW